MPRWGVRVGPMPKGNPEWRVVPLLDDLVEIADGGGWIFVDIPIRLPSGPEERQCHKKTRKMLGAPKASSVFRVPVRAVFAATDYAQAGNPSRAATAKGERKARESRSRRTQSSPRSKRSTGCSVAPPRLGGRFVRCILKCALPPWLEADGTRKEKGTIYGLKLSRFPRRPGVFRGSMLPRQSTAMG